MKPKLGFTLIELLIVLAILTLLIILGTVSWRRHLDKARDAQKKDHLQRISIAFEDYFNDHNCYPPLEILTNCGSDDLKPYLDKIPCDPITGEPYYYMPDPERLDCPKNYRLFTLLKNTSDPIINEINCHPNCGFNLTYNYGVSSKNVPVADPNGPKLTTNPSPSAYPSPSPTLKKYYCQSKGNCTLINSEKYICSPSYADPSCAGSNNCSIISTCQLK